MSASGPHDRVAITQKRTSDGIELRLYARQTSVVALDSSLAFGNVGVCVFKHSYGKDELEFSGLAHFGDGAGIFNRWR